MSQPYVIGFYGYSNSGKTTLILRLIEQLKKEKFVVGSIKQTDKPFSMDTPEKDTWKHKNAGADIVVFSSSLESTVLIPEPMKIQDVVEIMKKVKDLDIILVEGATDPLIPKIRIGLREERKNTVYTYDGDFNKLFKYLKQEIHAR